MTIARNPFKLRASEQATSDEDFLGLFGPRVLDLLPEDEMWDRPIVFASAPGAGKTTLLRLFTPGVLRSLYEARSIGENRELVQRLQSLGVLGDQGANVLGVLVNCREQYASIEDLPLDGPARLRWFFGLLDARVLLLTLRAALAMASLAYPQDVTQVEFRPKSNGAAPSDRMSGEELYEEARRREQTISEALDSLRGTNVLAAVGQSRLQSLRLLSTSHVVVHGQTVADRVIVMFDDVHALDAVQRRRLREDLEDRDLRVARWMAERYQAVGPSDLLGTARTEGRDFRQVRTFEAWARGARFEKVVFDIADRRSRRAELPFQSFATCLASTMSRDGERAQLSEALRSSQDMARQRGGKSGRFREWIGCREDVTGTTYEQAVRWRALAILIERERRRQQLSFDIPLGPDELERREGSDVESAAALFLSREHRLPYYFGSRCLAHLASLNIEQFLEVAGELFDKVLASATVSMNRRKRLTASEQHQLIRAISRRHLEALPRDLPHGLDVQRLVNSIGALCNKETYRPTAPYAPGATGVAISMRERDLLVDAAAAGNNARLARLFHALASAIAHNVLEARPDTRVKGGEWLVLYLNRIFCPAFGLPLQYGGFRERPLSDLTRWLDEGYRSHMQTRLAIEQ